jgi:hypothetical protein
MATEFAARGRVAGELAYLWHCRLTVRARNPELAHRIASGGRAQKQALKHILHVMSQHNWNVAHTAAALNVGTRTLFGWLQRFPLLAETRLKRRLPDTMQTSNDPAISCTLDVGE